MHFNGCEENIQCAPQVHGMQLLMFFFELPSPTLFPDGFEKSCTCGPSPFNEKSVFVHYVSLTIWSLYSWGPPAPIPGHRPEHPRDGLLQMPASTLVEPPELFRSVRYSIYGLLHIPATFLTFPSIGPF